MKLDCIQVALFDMPEDVARWVADLHYYSDDAIPEPDSVLEIGKSLAWEFWMHRKYWRVPVDHMAWRYMSWLLSKEDAFKLRVNEKGKVYRWIKPEYFWHIRAILSKTHLGFVGTE